jgi:hypothetical protein
MSRRYCPRIHGCLCGILFCQCWQYRLDVLLILPARSSRHGYDAAYYELLGLELVISSAFLTQMANTTPSLAFSFYAAVCFFSWVGVIFCYPDVNGMTLEDIQEVFQPDLACSMAVNCRVSLSAVTILRE